jgi:glycosyltransferase involved in cell wall biosynthesis
MNIVIAAWHLKNFNVGLGRYCRGLIEAIGRVDGENRYEVLMPDASYRFPERPNLRYRVIRFPVFKRRFWEQVAPLLASRHDVLHFPYDSCVAWKRRAFVVTMHDVKPLIFPMDAGSRSGMGASWRAWGGRVRWTPGRLIERLLIPDRVAQFDHVLTDSHCSRRDIIARLGVQPERITVVYPGVEMERFRSASGVLPDRQGGRPYVLCVAGADPTKNVETLVDAFARLPLPLREAHDLVLVGDFRRRSDLHERVKMAGIDKQTVFTGIVGDDRLIDLYRRAVLFVFPSLYEGFGFPVLEAMACGCPVVSSNASSLPEVTGKAALLVDPSDVEGFAKQMERVLTDPELRRDLHDRGMAQAAQFSWDRTARETIAVYHRVVRQAAGSA